MKQFYRLAALFLALLLLCGCAAGNGYGGDGITFHS